MTYSEHELEFTFAKNQTTTPQLIANNMSGCFFLKHGVLASRTCCTGISPFILPSFLAFSTTAVAQTIGTKYLFSDDFILSMTNCSLGSNSPAVDEQQLRLSQKCMIKVSTHRRNHGVQWVHLHPQGGELHLGVITRKN